MIWGKIKKEWTKRCEKNDKPNCYVFLPHRLRDGRWVWFEKVYMYFETWRVWGAWYYEIP